MMPFYGYPDSYPFSENQVPMMQYYRPNFGVIPPHTNVDSSKSTVIHEPWSYASNNGYSAPCHACCGHGYGNFPGHYSYRPPYPHISFPQFPWYAHHSTFPAHYFPPPYCSMDHPRYEYDMGVPRDYFYHCCGCPNHNHNQMNDEHVKVEEQELDGERKGVNYLALSEVKSYPYPIFWVSPNLMTNRSHRKPLESKMASKDVASQAMNPLEVQKLSVQEPKGWNGWFPIDMKSLGAVSQGGDENQTQNLQNENKEGQLSFPMIWMPSQDKQYDTKKGKQGDTNATSQSAEQPSSVIKFFPVKVPVDTDGTKKSHAIQENSGGEAGQEVKEGNVNQKTVPVKEMDAPSEKVKAEGTERLGRAVCSRKVEDNIKDKASVSNAKGQSASSPKTSKLPPVCLRVDPLRKNRNASSNSRSPSPPGFKGQQQAPLEDSLKSSASSHLKAKGPQDSQVKDNTLRSSKELEAERKERKVIEVVDRNDEEEGKAQVPISFPGNFQKEAVANTNIKKAEEDNSKSKVGDNEKPRNTGCLIAEEANEISCRGKRAESGEVKLKGERLILSEEEAALVIQSVYRGYEVRKWEPMKNLKRIAKVREQVVELRNQIHDLESSYNHPNDNQRRAILGEMIMGLLLQVDTIQGLHPSLRDGRKFLARELVTLQEKLDLLSEKSEEMAKSQPLMDSTCHPQNFVGMEKKQTEVGIQSSHGVSQVMDTKHNSQGEETSEQGIFTEEEHKKSVNEEVFLIENDLEFDGMPIRSQGGNGELHYSQMTDTKNQLGQSLPFGIEEASKLPLETNESEESRKTLQEDTCSGPTGEGKGTGVEENGLNKLPRGAVDEETTASDEANQVGREIMMDACGREMQSNISSYWDSLTGVDDLTIAAKCQQRNPVIERSLGVLNEEPEKQEKSEMQENDTLGGDVQQGAGTETASLQEEVPTGCATEHHLVEVINEGLSIGDLEKEVKSHITELLLGALDKEEPEKHEKCEMQENLDRGGGDVECNAGIDTPSLQKEVPTGCATEQHRSKVINDDLSGADSEKEVKSQKDDYGAGDASLGATLQEPQPMEVHADEGQVKVSGALETQEVALQMHSALHEEKDNQQIGSVDYDTNSGSVDKMTASKEEDKQTGKGEDSMDELKSDGGNGGMTQEENEDHYQEMTSKGNTMADQLDGSEAAEDSVVGPHQMVPTFGQNDEKRTKTLPSSSTDSHLPNEDQDFVMECNRQLVEENAKLKKMLEKLLEAGKEQLNVISNLSGRVNHMEKMLSRSDKKARRRRHWRTFTAASCAKPSKESTRKKAIDVAS